MRRFVFRLQRILSFRHSLTEAEKSHFGRKVSELRRAQDNASVLRGIRNETQLTRMQSLRHGIPAREACNLHEHLLRIEEAIDSADKKVEAAELEVDRAREKLVERRRDERVVELLRDRRHAAWLLDYYRDEGKVLDDIATIRHARSSDDSR